MAELSELAAPAPRAPPAPAPLVAARFAGVPAPKAGSLEERLALLATLERTGENVTSTAGELRVSRVTLYRMLRRHGIVLKRGMAEPPPLHRARYARL